MLDAALYRYLRGRRVDVQSLAAELGLGRTTIYRWFGSRDRLIGEVLVRAAEPILDDARAQARKTRPARAPRSLRPRQPELRRSTCAPSVRRAGARDRPADHDLGLGDRAALPGVADPGLDRGRGRRRRLRRAGRARDARVRDRPSRGGLPLQRRRTRDARGRRPAARGRGGSPGNPRCRAEHARASP